MQCKKCGETFKLFDYYCRKCGEKRELLTYGPAHESELDFAFHSEYYSYVGGSVLAVHENSPRIPLEFCEYNGFIYALKKRAVVKIDSKGNHTWIRLENGEDDAFYPNAIFVNSQGIFIRSGETEFFLYDETGKLLKRKNFTYEDAEYADCYIFRDKVYIMYIRSYASYRAPFVVEYNMINDTMRTVLDFDSFWDEIMERFRFEERINRRKGMSFREKPIPDSNDISYIDEYYARPKRFGVNSRRLVAVFDVIIDGDFYGGSNVLLLDVNLNDLSVTLLAEYDRAFGDMRFLDMSTETIWLRKKPRDTHICQYPLDQHQKWDSVLPLNQWPDRGRNTTSYMDGKNYYFYYPKNYSFASVEKDETVTVWSENSQGEDSFLTVLGDFLYECHGNIECVHTWDFYYKKNTPELAFSISLDDLEKEYENPDLCVTPEELVPVDSTVQVNKSQPVEEPTQVEVPEQKEMPLIKFCMSCGAKVVPGAKFCYECGAELKLKF